MVISFYGKKMWSFREGKMLEQDLKKVMTLQEVCILKLCLE